MVIECCWSRACYISQGRFREISAGIVRYEDVLFLLLVAKGCNPILSK